MSALNTLNLTIVDNQDVFTVYKIRNAIKKAIPSYGPNESVPATAQIVRKHVKLKHADVHEMQRILRRFTSSNAVVAHIPTQSLILSETGHSLKSLLTYIALFDAPCDKRCQARVSANNDKQCADRELAAIQGLVAKCAPKQSLPAKHK